MISGNNGVLTLAVKAKDNTKITATNEELKLEILDKKIEAQKNNENLTRSKLTEDDEYKIQGLEHIDGSEYKYQGQTIYISDSFGTYNELIDIKDLNVGDIINYSTIEGTYTANSSATGVTEAQEFRVKNGNIECIVFSKSEDGTIRIIPKTCIGNLTLAGRNSFYGVESVLNNISQLYLNGEYATKSVSLGANNTYVDETKQLIEIYNMGYNKIMGECIGYWPGASGWQTVSKTPLTGSSWQVDGAWLPSAYYNNNNDHFRIRFCQSNTDVVQDVRMWDGTWTSIYMYEMGVVPVITLKSSIKVGRAGGIYNIIEN